MIINPNYFIDENLKIGFKINQKIILLIMQILSQILYLFFQIVELNSDILKKT